MDLANISNVSNTLEQLLNNKVIQESVDQLLTSADSSVTSAQDLDVGIEQLHEMPATVGLYMCEVCTKQLFRPIRNIPCKTTIIRTPDIAPVGDRH